MQAARGVGVIPNSSAQSAEGVSPRASPRYRPRCDCFKGSAARLYSLAQEQDDSALMIGAYRALACTLYYLGDFETARQYAMLGVEMWRSESIRSPVEEVTAPAVSCLISESLSEWHLGEIVA